MIGMAPAAKPRKIDPMVAGRREARLAAVQAIYQMDMTGITGPAVIDEFIHHRLTDTADKGHFGMVVEGVWLNRKDFDALIVANLVEGWTIERIDPVLRAILRGGLYELHRMPEVPGRVVVSEYVGLAHDFFDGTDGKAKEPGMVNAMLDKLGKLIRAAEFERK